MKPEKPKLGRPRKFDEPLTERITVFVTRDLRERIDAARGDTPEPDWLRGVLESACSVPISVK